MWNKIIEKEKNKKERGIYKAGGLKYTNWNKCI